MPTGGSSSTATPFGGTSVMRPVRRRGRPASPRRGSVAYGSTAEALAVLGGGLAYHVYANTGAGDPINYATPIATVSGTAWTSGTLAAPGTWSFGVRAFDGNGEEQNLDCAVVIVLDGNGNDITNRPMPPVGLRAFATAERVDPGRMVLSADRRPKGADGVQRLLHRRPRRELLQAPAATVPFNIGIFNSFVANLTSLSGGTTYSIGVRAYNASGEEANYQHGQRHGRRHRARRRGLPRPPPRSSSRLPSARLGGPAIRHPCSSTLHSGRPHPHAFACLLRRDARQRDQRCVRRGRRHQDRRGVPGHLDLHRGPGHLRDDDRRDRPDGRHRVLGLQGLRGRGVGTHHAHGGGRDRLDLALGQRHPGPARRPAGRPCRPPPPRSANW